MMMTYPSGYEWYGKQDRPIYLQEAQPDVPSSLQFPFQHIIGHFNTRFFTCSLSWQIAFAMMLGFSRIELWGYELGATYEFEKPCISYWIQRARNGGIDIMVPSWVDIGPPGDPDTYNGPLYGLGTT
jgi:hypothetical protein